MGDLKASEAFQECVFITVTATGLGAVGLVPTCIAVRISNNTRTPLTVQEVGSGWYRVTDLAGAIGNEEAYGTEWAVAGAHTIHGFAKVYKVGGGLLADVYARLGAPAGASLAADLLAIDNLVDDLEARLTAARAGYMDNINQAGLLQATAARMGYLDELAAANLPADLDGLIADMGVFPTANFATLAAYVEAVRTRLVDIEADTAGLAGSAMIGTNNAALAASWTAALATALGSYTAARGGYLDELAAAAIPADVDEIKTQTFSRIYEFDPEVESVANAAEVSLTSPGNEIITFPTGATKIGATVVATITASNRTAAKHLIGLTLQENLEGAGFTDISADYVLTATPPLSLPAVDGASSSLTLIAPVGAFVTTDTLDFRFQVDSDNAGAVVYTTTYVLKVEYDYQ